MPEDDGPQLEQCCIVVLRCLQTSIVLLGNNQLAENIEDIAKMVCDGYFLVIIQITFSLLLA